MSARVRARSIDDLLAEVRKQIERLTPEEAFAAVQEGAVLVDVRSEDERRRQGVVRGRLAERRSPGRSASVVISAAS